MPAPEDTLAVLDELERLGFASEAFQRLHQFCRAGTPVSIARHRAYCAKVHAFRPGDENSLTHRRLEFVLRAYRDWELAPGQAAVFDVLAEAAFLGIPPKAELESAPAVTANIGHRC